MIDKYVLATNDDGDLAIRTVSATESSSVTDTTSVITVTDDGKLAVRVVGSGGGDQHNLGYYADLTALQTAYPTGTDGDFAILGSTDTIWVWDSGTSAWKDTDTKGQVTSVNGQTGAVTLTIPAAQVNSDWNASSGVAEILNKPTLATVATSGAYSDLTGTPTIPAAIQVSTMPTAAVGELDKIYQFIGTTDANYTNGYFYKCVSDGQNPATYSWTQTDVQPQAGGLPSQTGQSGKFLTTDGTDASWSDKPLVNKTSFSASLSVAGNAATSNYCVNVGIATQAGGGSGYATAVGYYARATSTSAVAIGESSNATGGGGATAIGGGAQATQDRAIQLGAGTNNVSATFKVGFANLGNYELLNSSGKIPTDRFTTTPVADGTYVPTLTIASGVATRSWSAPSGGGSVPTLTWYSVSTAGNTITIADTSSAQLVKVYKNGLLLQPTDDYTISGTTLTTVAALVVGDKITTEVF